VSVYPIIANIGGGTGPPLDTADGVPGAGKLSAGLYPCGQPRACGERAALGAH
jgi:hypothetical protein